MSIRPLVLLVCLVAFLAQNVLAAEIIQNGGFEDGITGWSPVVNYAGSWSIGSVAHGGEKALSITIDESRSNVYVYYSQVFTETPPSYMLSFWIRPEDGGQDICLADGWRISDPFTLHADPTDLGHPVALWVSFLPVAGGLQVRMRANNQDPFEYSAFWPGSMGAYHHVEVYTCDDTRTRSLWTDGSLLLACALTSTVKPDSMLVGDMDGDRSDPFWEPQGGTVLWDDISLQPVTPEGPPCATVPLLPEMAIPLGLVIVAFKCRRRRGFSGP